MQFRLYVFPYELLSYEKNEFFKILKKKVWTELRMFKIKEYDHKPITRMIN